jgi:hypothetical protein
MARSTAARIWLTDRLYAFPVGVQEQDRDAWSAELRTLLDSLDSLTAKPSTGRTVAELRRALRLALHKGWMGYSKGYFDRLRDIAPLLGIEATWQGFTSQIPAPATPVPDDTPSPNEVQIAALIEEIPWDSLSETQIGDLDSLLDQLAVSEDDLSMLQDSGVNQ